MKKIKYIVLIISVFLIDQISKIIVMNTLSLDKSTSVIGDFFRLTYTHNNGAAFGLFGGKLALIIIVSLIVLCYLLYELFYHKKSGTLIKIASSLMISGLLGNLLDRIYFGYVRDFFDFKIFNYDFAVFNVGDIAIVVGAFLYLIGAFLEGRHEKNNK